MGIHNDPRYKNEAERVRARQEQFSSAELSRLFSHTFNDDELEQLGQKNCQNMIGSVEVPVGVAGPVPVALWEGERSTSLEYMIPLATTEGALVASIHRGCKALRSAGNVRVIVEQRGMTRAPVFRCHDGVSAAHFLQWAKKQRQIFQDIANEVSTHLSFIDLDGFVQGNLVFLRCRYNPDQAMGMNMVSIALDKTWQVLKQRLSKELPECQVEMIALSGNLCTDKKTAAVNRLLGRGWWVQAEIFLPEEVIADVLKTSASAISQVHIAKNVVGSYLAGDAAQNMQIANAVAAFFIATGQDPAHVVDVSQGATSVELREGGLYVAVTLPTVPVGVVGGGTWLPAQKEARQLLLNTGEMPTAAQLAGAVAVAALAGEVSGIAALANHHLAIAHQTLGRNQQSGKEQE